MKTIYKYPIAITRFQSIYVQPKAKPVHVGLDPQGQPCIWCEAETAANERELLDIFVIGTGHELSCEARNHIGSFVQGLFVWHIYTPLRPTRHD